MLYVIHHWLLPVISAFVWFGMLWGMLIYWLVNGEPRYSWQDGKIAFISDIGATKLQPLFIAGSSVMSLFFVLSVASDRLLRHQSRLLRNWAKTERVLSYLAILGACIGSLGIILVSCLNTHIFPTEHDTFLCVFIVGVALSAIFSTAEFGLLDKNHHDFPRLHGYLRVSYIFKIAIVFVEVVLAIAFGSILFDDSKHNIAAIIEWTISFLFTFYLLSWAIDLWPARHAEKGQFADDGGEAGLGSMTVVGTGEDAQHMREMNREDSGASLVQGNDRVALQHLNADHKPVQP